MVKLKNIFNLLYLFLFLLSLSIPPKKNERLKISYRVQNIIIGTLGETWSTDTKIRLVKLY